ncbi:nucleotidyl transferase AbiEii/AbiGii toxin family protein [Natronogracilivirga saccharolytica]|uniref:Nucleotidyl transferase AbiEii/AbiGii toxin family protein n=1 Tax=Natronogracilivirga saccharolytica TaxID=2812953 RepID=A0A8J7S813_9BACT|nr:nucleotidyl transferase AbiEii/AbiGii toxin family protein [Natronogracilivirga saccharolytica]
MQTFYPEPLRRFPRFLLREYLQCKILEIIYDSPYANGLSFLGGTCLRIVHGNQRFSEDLDFDNLALGEADFEKLAGIIEKELTREGFETEMRTVLKGVWHCHITFPGLLFGEGLSGHKEEKFLIRMDTESQHFNYDPERFVLNRFEVFTTVLLTPLPLLMAQKLHAIINRERNKGRDFHDLVFLMSRNIKPDYSYLKEKISVSDAGTLKNAVLERCRQLDMDEMAGDVEPFLFNPSDKKKVVQFQAVVRQYAF